jgi:phage-related protein
MAIVGDAYIVVRALTNRLESDIRSGLRGVGSVGEDAGKEIGDSFSRGLSSSGGKSSLFSSKFLNEAEQARQSLNKLIQTGYFLGPALAGVAGAVGSLGAALVSLVSVLGAAAPAAIVLVGALTALAQAAIVAKIAFAGVGKAIGAGLKAAKGSAKDTDALADATRRVEDANRRYFRLLNEGRPELLIQLTERQKDAEDSLANSKISATRAERTYKESQEKTKKAIENLNKAREDAKEKLQQLRFEVEGGAISEKKARLEFEKARDSLQRVQDLPPNSRARQEAELAFAEADLNLRRAIDKNKDLKAEEKKATAAGVEGAQAVKDAVLSRRDAVNAEADALINSKQAKKGVLDAEKALAEATAEAGNNPNVQSKALRDFDRQVADAKRAVEDAKRDEAKARKGSGTDAYADALAGLSPEAKDFVKYIVSLKGAFERLKAAAGKDLFPKLTTAIKNLVTEGNLKIFEDLLRGTGSAIGDVAIEISKAVTETENFKALQSVWKTNDRLIRKLGKASGNLYGAFINLLDAAGPLIDKFGDWIVKVTETWEQTVKAKKATGELTDNFNKAGKVAGRIGGILKNYFKGFQEIGKAVMNGGAGERLLKYFEDASKRFADLMKQMNGDGSLGKYFDKATENGLKVLDLLVNIVAELLKLGDDEGVGKFVDSLSRAVDTFGEIGGNLTDASPALGTFVEQFAILIKNLTESGSINTFFGILTDALEILNKILGSEIAKAVIGFLAPIFAATRAFGLMFKIAKFGFMAMAGNIAAPFKAIGNLKKNVGKAKDAFDTMRLKGMYAMDSIKSGFAKVGKAAGTAKTAIGNALTTAGQGIKAGATKGFDALKTGFSTLGTAAKNAAIAVGNALKRIVFAVGNALKAIGRALLANPWILIIIAIVALVIIIVKNWDKIKEVVGAAVEWIGQKVGAAWDWIKEKTSGVLSAVVTFFTELPGKLLTAIQGLATTVLEFIVKYHPLAILWRLVSENWESIKTWFTSLPGKIKDAVVGLSTTVSEFIYKYHPILILWRLVTENWEKIKTWFTGLPTRIKDALVGLSTTVSEFITKYNPIALLKKAVEGVWPTVSSFITSKLDSIVTFIKGLPSKIASAASGMFNGLKEAFRGAINFIIDKWNGLSFTLPSVSVFGKKIGGFTLSTPDIPRLAMGGVIPPSPGGTLATIGEAGRPERVEPLDPDGLSKRDKAIISMLAGNGAGGATINVYPSAGMNERELANLVSKQLAYQMRKGAA